MAADIGGGNRLITEAVTALSSEDVRVGFAVGFVCVCLRVVPRDCVRLPPSESSGIPLGAGSVDNGIAVGCSPWRIVMVRRWPHEGANMHDRPRSYGLRTRRGVPVSMRQDPWVFVIAQVQSELEAEVVADASEILVAEQARTTLMDRLRIGAEASLALSSGAWIRGVVVELVDGFVDVVDHGGDAHLVNLGHVDVITGVPGSLGRRPDPGATGRWSTIVRALEGEVVQVELRGGQRLQGHVGAVGADHVDLLVECVRMTIPIDAISRLRRRHRTDVC